MATVDRIALSRDLIAATALDLLDEHGVEALSMRGLAKALRVKAPSLYNHVEGIDDIIDMVQELVDQEIDQDPILVGDWPLREGLAAVARSYRAAYMRHPAALSLVVRRVMKAPTAIALYDNLAAFMIRHGVPTSELLTSLAMIDGLVIGSTVDTFHTDFGSAEYASRYPALATALADARSDHPVDDAAFESALVAVLNEVAARVRQ